MYAVRSPETRFRGVVYGGA